MHLLLPGDLPVLRGRSREKRFYDIRSMQPEYTSGYFLSSQYDCYPASFSFPLLFLLLRRGLSAQLYYFQGDVYFTPDTFKIFYLCLDFCNFVKIFQGFVFCFWGFFLMHPISDLRGPVTL